MLRSSFAKSRGEYFNGMPGHFPILAITTLTNMQMLATTSFANVVAQMSFLQALAFPFLTA